MLGCLFTNKHSLLDDKTATVLFKIQCWEVLQGPFSMVAVQQRRKYMMTVCLFFKISPGECYFVSSGHLEK